jgi:hypothetical protein
MVRHDPHGYNGEPDPPGTPGVRALGAMAAAAQRAREVQEGGPPTHAVETRFDDEPTPARPNPPPVARAASGGRSPLEVAVWVAAALLLVAAGALAVTLGTRGGGNGAGGPSAPPSTAAHTAAPAGPHGQAGAQGGSGSNPSGGSGSTSTTTSSSTLPPNASGPPVIAALNPASGNAGQAIQVAGANFLSSSGQIIATFDGQVAPTSCPAQNTCSVTVPPAPSGTQSAQVVITTAGGTSNTVTFTYS